MLAWARQGCPTTEYAENVIHVDYDLNLWSFPMRHKGALHVHVNQLLMQDQALELLCAHTFMCTGMNPETRA